MFNSKIKVFKISPKKLLEATFILMPENDWWPILFLNFDD